jgi:hypothetical protein
MTTRSMSAAIAIAATFLIASSFGLQARERLTYTQGMKQCQAWCDSHNTTSKAKNQCLFNCDQYWGKNGSDVAK